MTWTDKFGSFIERATTRTERPEIDQYGNSYGGGEIPVVDCELCEKEVDEDTTEKVELTTDLLDEGAEIDEKVCCSACMYHLIRGERVKGWFKI